MAANHKLLFLLILVVLLWQPNRAQQEQINNQPKATIQNEHLQTASATTPTITNVIGKCINQHHETGTRSGQHQFYYPNHHRYNAALEIQPPHVPSLMLPQSSESRAITVGRHKRHWNNVAKFVKDTPGIRKEIILNHTIVDTADRRPAAASGLIIKPQQTKRHGRHHHTYRQYNSDVLPPVPMGLHEYELAMATTMASAISNGILLMDNHPPQEPVAISAEVYDINVNSGKILHWPVKKEAIMEGDLVLGGLMMVHSREDTMMCGPIMPQGGIQALEAMLYTLDSINRRGLLPNITIGAHILDDCDRDSYGLEMAVDFIKGKPAMKFSWKVVLLTLIHVYRGPDTK